MFKQISAKFTVALLLILTSIGVASAQKKTSKKQDERVRTMTIPISIFTKKEQRENRAEEFVQVGDLQVKEDKEDQVILSIRSVTNTPLAIAVLIQDDLTPDTNLKLNELRKFIRELPAGSRVMTAYMRSGALQVRQKFTEDLEKAAKSLRIVTGSSAAAPSSPYYQLEEALKRFDALPTGWTYRAASKARRLRKVSISTAPFFARSAKASPSIRFTRRQSQPEMKIHCLF
jgi:hypothetical protein